MNAPNIQWKYLLINEDGTICGTNSQLVAKAMSSEDTGTVIDTTTCQVLVSTSDATVMAAENIPQQNFWQED